MSDDGRLHFGVDPGGGVRTVNSSAAFNDGAWHFVAASLGADGMRLSVDGRGGRLTCRRHPRPRVRRTLAYRWRQPERMARTAEQRLLRGATSTTSRSTTVCCRSHRSNASTRSRPGGPVPNAAPSAAFVHSVDSATVSVDASTSTDTDGAIVSWSWDFGDGTTASTVTADPYVRRPWHIHHLAQRDRRRRWQPLPRPRRSRSPRRRRRTRRRPPPSPPLRPG